MVWLLLVAGVCVPALGQGSDAGSAAREVLSDPAYQRWTLRQDRPAGGDGLGEAEAPGWAGRAVRWVGETVGAVWDWLTPKRRSRPRSGAPGAGGSGGGGFGFADALRVAGWVVLAVVVGFLLVLALNAWGRRERHEEVGVASREAVARALETGDAAAADAGQWLDEAHRRLSDRDLRLTFRALYLGLLAGLHEAEKIDYRRNRTNWQYVRRFRGETAERDRFERLTSLFDAVWYGHRPIDEKAYRRVRAEVVELVGEGVTRGV